MVGDLDGGRVGNIVGFIEGITVGISLGTNVGFWDDGMKEGNVVGET